jgi:hypothetical protein
MGIALGVLRAHRLEDDVKKGCVDLDQVRPQDGWGEVCQPVHADEA